MRIAKITVENCQFLYFRICDESYEDFEIHCWKNWRNSFFVYILSICDEMLLGFQKWLLKKSKKFQFLMYSIILWWNALRISKPIVEKNFLKKVRFWCILSYCDEMPLWIKKMKNVSSYVFYYFVIKCCEDFKNHCWKNMKNVNSYVFYYFMMKCCDDFKNYCWKFWKVQYLCVLLFCYEMLWEFQISLLQILKYITKCL